MLPWDAITEEYKNDYGELFKNPILRNLTITPIKEKEVGYMNTKGCFLYFRQCPGLQVSVGKVGWDTFDNISRVYLYGDIGAVRHAAKTLAKSLEQWLARPENGAGTEADNFESPCNARCTDEGAILFEEAF